MTESNKPRSLSEAVAQLPATALEYGVEGFYGLKSMAVEASVALRLGTRLARGDYLTWRQKWQLRRVLTDVFRNAPDVTQMLLIPFLTALWKKTDTSKSKAEQERQALRAEFDLSAFLHDILESINPGLSGLQPQAAQNALEAMTTVRLSYVVDKILAREDVPKPDLLDVARLLDNETVLYHANHDHLAQAARRVGVEHAAGDAQLRWAVGDALRNLAKDDKALVGRNLDDLTEEELASACARRGLDPTRADDDKQSAFLAAWLELTAEGVPPAVLIISPALTAANEPNTRSVLRDALAAALSETLSEAVELRVAQAEAERARSGKGSQYNRAENLRIESEWVAGQDRIETQRTPSLLTAAGHSGVSSSLPSVASHRMAVQRLADTLAVMASPSPVARDQKRVGELMARHQAMRASWFKGRGFPPQYHGLYHKVFGLAASLADRLEQRERALGSSLHVIDLDRDGVISAEELAEALRRARLEAWHVHETHAAAAFVTALVAGDKKLTVARLHALSDGDFSVPTRQQPEESAPAAGAAASEAPTHAAYASAPAPASAPVSAPASITPPPPPAPEPEPEPVSPFVGSSDSTAQTPAKVPLTDLNTVARAEVAPVAHSVVPITPPSPARREVPLEAEPVTQWRADVAPPRRDEAATVPRAAPPADDASACPFMSQASPPKAASRERAVDGPVAVARASVAAPLSDIEADASKRLSVKTRAPAKSVGAAATPPVTAPPPPVTPPELVRKSVAKPSEQAIVKKDVAKDASTKDTSTKSPSVKEVSTKVASTKDTSTKTFSAKEAKEVSTKVVSTKDTSSKSASTKETSTKTASTKEMTTPVAAAEESAAPKRGRGRPKKDVVAQGWSADDVDASQPAKTPVVKKKVVRRKSSKAVAEDESKVAGPPKAGKDSKDGPKAKADAGKDVGRSTKAEAPKARKASAKA